jgi:hypothetical protein
MGYGSNEFNVQSPTAVQAQDQALVRRQLDVALCVAVQVAFVKTLRLG